MTTNATNVVLKRLESGNPVTETFVTKRNLGNVHDIVKQLRNAGHCVYFNKRVNSESFYRLGSPSRNIVKTAYKNDRTLFGN